MSPAERVSAASLVQDERRSGAGVLLEKAVGGLGMRSAWTHIDMLHRRLHRYQSCS